MHPNSVIAAMVMVGALSYGLSSAQAYAAGHALAGSLHAFFACWSVLMLVFWLTINLLFKAISWWARLTRPSASH